VFLLEALCLAKGTDLVVVWWGVYISVLCACVRVRGSPHSVGAVFVHNILKAWGF
jgi:hypothetical protein